MLRSSADAVPGPYHSITVSTGLGGSVSRTPIGNPLVHGTLVTLEAEPDSGFYFLGWQGDLAGDGNPVAFSLISDLSVTASFDSVGFIVGTSVEGAGAVVRSPEKVQYRPGTVVTLAAVPTQGHRFVGWSGDTTEVASVLTVTVQRVLNFMATFELDPNAAPSSVQATDVPQDQGGAIVLGWNASPLDVLGPGQLLSSYRIDRRASAPAGGGWNAVGLQGALGLPNYSLLLATPADSSSLSNWSFDYRVVALSATDTTQWVSHAVTGWSVDNVPPSSPTSVSGSMASGIATMFWPAVTATDFSEYRIYRGHAIDFVPTAPSRVGTTSETGFTDFAGAFAYYKVTAADTHGNESPGTLFVPSNPVSVEETLLPGSFTIQLQGPTPSNEVPVRIRFGVPSPMTVRIDVVDIQGRVLRQLRAAEANAGWHDLSWDRKDDSGGRVAPGLYFLRAAERSAVHTRRLVLL